MKAEKHDAFASKVLFGEKDYKEIKKFYLQPILKRLKNGLEEFESEEGLALLHFSPITLSPFLISTDCSLSSFTKENFDAHHGKPPSPPSLILKEIKISPPTSLSLSREQYDKLHFFHVLMLHMINSATIILLEAILLKKTIFGTLFDEVVGMAGKSKSGINSGFKGTIFNDFEVPSIKDPMDLCGILVVPSIKATESMEAEVDWKTVENSIEFMRNMIKVCSKLPVGSGVKLREGDLLIYPASFKAVSILSINASDKNSSAIIFTLPETKEAAFIQHSGTEKMDSEESKIGEISIESIAPFATGIPAKVYLGYVYVPSMLIIINEKYRFQELAEENIQTFMSGCDSDPAVLKAAAGLYADYLEEAFTAGHAQRGVANDRLFLLGKAVAICIVSHYVSFIIVQALLISYIIRRVQNVLKED